MSVEQLQAKVHANDELIARLRARVGVLEHRLRVALAETRRARTHPLPAGHTGRTKLRVADAVLAAAPTNAGREASVLATPGALRPRGRAFCVELV